MAAGKLKHRPLPNVQKTSRNQYQDNDIGQGPILEVLLTAQPHEQNHRGVYFNRQSLEPHGLTGFLPEPSRRVVLETPF